MMSNFISSFRRKQHGGGSKVTGPQLYCIFFGFSHKVRDDDTFILLGQTYQTTKQMCMVFATLRWLCNARLQAIKAERCAPSVWSAIDGTCKTIGKKPSIFLKCTLTGSHRVAILGIAIATSQNKFSIRYFWKPMRKKSRGTIPWLEMVCPICYR